MFNNMDEVDRGFCEAAVRHDGVEILGRVIRNTGAPLMPVLTKSDLLVHSTTAENGAEILRTGIIQPGPGVCGHGVYCFRFLHSGRFDDLFGSYPELSHAGIEASAANGASYEAAMMFIGRPSGIHINWDGKGESHPRGDQKAFMNNPNHGVPRGVTTWRLRYNNKEVVSPKTQFAVNPRSIEWLYVVMNTWAISADMFPFLERAGMTKTTYDAVIAAVSSHPVYQKGLRAVVGEAASAKRQRR